MSATDVTAADLGSYIIATLAKRTDRGRGFWRRAICPVEIEAGRADGSNWTLDPTGSAETIALIDEVVREVRQAFPTIAEAETR